MEMLDTLGRHSGPRGEVVLRHRSGVGPDVEELIVNGIFAMDSTDTETERRLAEVALAGLHRALPGVVAYAAGVQGGHPPRSDQRAVPGVVARAAGVQGGRPPRSDQRAVPGVVARAAGVQGGHPPRSDYRRVLVGGLGLGYTAAQLLAADVDHLDVVEIEDCLVDWAYAGLTPTLASVANDPRVSLHAADVTAVLAGLRGGPSGPWNAIVLDVDNGPDFLIHAANSALYADPGLGAAYQQLSSGGTLAIWCQGPAPELLARMRRISPTARPHTYHRTRQGRRLSYVIYTLTKPWVPSPLEGE